MIIVIDSNILLYSSKYKAESHLDISENHILELFLQRVFSEIIEISKRKGGEKLRVYALWDDGIAPHKKVVEYKLDRKKDNTEADLNQKKASLLARDLFDKIGICNIASEDAEADDFAYFIAATMSNDDKVYLVSEDKDWHQCLLNTNIVIKKPKKGIYYYLSDFQKNCPIKEISPIKYLQWEEALIGGHNNVPRALPSGIGEVKVQNVIKAILENKPIPYIDQSKKVEILENFNKYLKIIDLSFVLEDEIKSKFEQIFKESHKKTRQKTLSRNEQYKLLQKHCLYVNNILTTLERVEYDNSKRGYAINRGCRVEVK